MFHCQSSSTLNQVMLGFKGIPLNVLHRLLPSSHVGSPEQPNTDSRPLLRLLFTQFIPKLDYFLFSCALQFHHTLYVLSLWVWALACHFVSSLWLIKWHSCVSWSPLPLPSVLTRHLLILSLLPLYCLRPLRELILYKLWQAIKDGGHVHIHRHNRYAVDMQNSHEMSSKSS